ncbi:MAG: protein translocase subunit SecF [Candidatus Gracilibacteria bacterium]|jgi:SecD/SecF fusion protein
MKKYFSTKLIVIIVTALLLGFFGLPAETQKKLVPFTPEWITKSRVHLGLDLQGGSQLDYKIDLRNVPEADRQTIIDGVKGVIEKRVNGLGVAEPNIYISDVANEVHIIVEIAESGVLTQADIDTYLSKDKKLESLTDDEKKTVSLEKAKAIVGKTIQLEFKEEKGTLDPAEKDKIKENAESALAKIKNGDKYEVIGQEDQQAYPGKVKFETVDFTFASKLPTYLQEILPKLQPDEMYSKLVETGGSFAIDANGQTQEETGLGIVKLLEVKEEAKDKKEVSTSHILISSKEATGADATVTRTEDEAYKLAKEIVDKLKNGDDFAVLAQQYSNDNSNKDKGGRLEKPVTGDGTYVYDFEQAALKLNKEGDLSDPVKTEFGYHIIKANEVKTDTKENKYRYEIINYSTVPDPWKETGLSGKHFTRADVQIDNFYQPYVSIQFNEEGAKLFEEITGRNVDKRIAIFVGGEFISSPRVNEKIAGGKAQISGQFTNEEATKLAQNLNTGAIPAPIILAGEYTIGATLGQEALQKSIYAGIIGFVLIMIFMVGYYRLPGLLATLALSFYTIIMIFLIKSELNLGIALGISLAIFGFLVVKVINNKDSTWEKFLSFVLACVGFFFLTFMLKTAIVMTVAGIAGVIISLGMAVDANVLIFERFKEEIKTGKTFGAALEAGFARAWNAIRDSHFSALITCALLFYFGSSTVKGFAFNLSAGIVVSLFTAITVTKTLIIGFVGTKTSENLRLFGVNLEKKPFHFGFLKASKPWLIFSGILTAIALASFLIFGFNLGTDFTGGTLLEFKFKEPITKEVLSQKLITIEEELNAAGVTNKPVASPIETKVDETLIQSTEGTKLDFKGAKIMLGGDPNNFIVKTKYIDSATHEQIIKKMKETLPEFTEPRFTTIGPTLGASLLNKAMIAIIIAIIAIIFYITLAFRRIPKEIGPFKFGVAAIIALLHDVLVVTGLIVLIGQVFNAEIDGLFITALLTILGYSVSDTIVIFDRIRENVLLAGKDEKFEDICDKSINETLARSLNTTISTLLPLFSILLFGSSSIFYFVLALTVGVATGAYSSIFIAPPIIIAWKKWADKKQMRP